MGDFAVVHSRLFCRMRVVSTGQPTNMKPVQSPDWFFVMLQAIILAYHCGVPVPALASWYRKGMR